MIRSGVRCNHADNDIDKSENVMEIERERVVDSAFLEGDAQNIAACKLVPDL